MIPSQPGHRRAYRLLHVSRAELRLKELLEEFSAVQSLEFMAEVASVEVSAFLPGHNIAVLVEDESHDHSDGYYRNVTLLEQLDKAGVRAISIPGWQLLKDTEAVRDRLRQLL